MMRHQREPEVGPASNYFLARYDSGNNHDMNRHFDLLTIGAASGGVPISNRAAAHGPKCALIQPRRLRGPCVHVGCVPKKVMWNAAMLSHSLHAAPDYGFSIPSHA